MQNVRINLVQAIGLAAVGLMYSAIASFILTIGGFDGNGEIINHAFSGDAWMPAYILVLSPVLEELIFRGLLFKLLLIKVLRLELWCAAGSTSLVFGLLHYPVASMLIALVFSMILCFLYNRKGRILYCVCMHFGFNLFSFCIVLLT